jgi:hypothetical protein
MLFWYSTEQFNLLLVDLDDLRAVDRPLSRFVPRIFELPARLIGCSAVLSLFFVPFLSFSRADGPPWNVTGWSTRSELKNVNRMGERGEPCASPALTSGATSVRESSNPILAKRFLGWWYSPIHYLLQEHSPSALQTMEFISVNKWLKGCLYHTFQFLKIHILSLLDHQRTIQSSLMPNPAAIMSQYPTNILHESCQD